VCPCIVTVPIPRQGDIHRQRTELIHRIVAVLPPHGAAASKRVSCLRRTTYLWLIFLIDTVFLAIDRCRRF
jgi:hypothetical protein